MTRRHANNGAYSNERAHETGDARDPLGRSFLAGLTADYAQHGNRTLKKLRRKRPQDYFKLVAAFLPKKFRADWLTLDDISDDEYAEILAAIRAALGCDSY